MAISICTELEFDSLDTAGSKPEIRKPSTPTTPTTRPELLHNKDDEIFKKKFQKIRNL